MAEKAIAQPPIFFPPPPRAAAISTDSNKSTPFRLNFKTRPSTSDSTASRSSSSSSSFHKPSTTSSSIRPTSTKSKVLAIKRTRQYILLLQLLLSFCILILSIMFAYCAALPHSDNILNNSSSPSSSSPSSSSTLSSRSPTKLSSRILARQIITTTSTTTTDAITTQKLAEDATNNALFTTRPAMASLTFYSATLPLLTIAHTATELLSSLVRPETSQNTRFGTALRSRHGRRVTSLLSFTVSAALALGWIVVQLFWTNCELVGFMGPRGTDGQAVCPVQIRGHRMAGISGLSVGKVAMGWVIVLIYVVYSAFMYLKVGVLKKGGHRCIGPQRSTTVSFRRRARYEMNDGGRGEKDREEEEEEQEAETVFIGIDVQQKPFGR